MSPRNSTRRTCLSHASTWALLYSAGPGCYAALCMGLQTAGAERRAKVLPGQRRRATARRCHLLWGLVDGCLAALSKNESRVVATGFFGALGFFNSRLPRFRPLAMAVSYLQTRIIEELPCGETTARHQEPTLSHHRNFGRARSVVWDPTLIIAIRSRTMPSRTAMLGAGHSVSDVNAPCESVAAESWRAAATLSLGCG